MNTEKVVCMSTRSLKEVKESTENKRTKHEGVTEALHANPRIDPNSGPKNKAEIYRRKKGILPAYKL